MTTGMRHFQAPLPCHYFSQLAVFVKSWDGIPAANTPFFLRRSALFSMAIVINSNSVLVAL